MPIHTENWNARFINLLLSKRKTLKKRHQLTHKNLFIFPSLLGLCYLLFIMLLWLLGTNYQNNLILALSYLLISIMLVSIFHSYVNLQGLTVSVAPSAAVFCGEIAIIPLCFESAQQGRYQGIKIGWRGAPIAPIEWGGKGEIAATLAFKTTVRGKIQVPRLELRSYYPLGLLRCWCLLPLDLQVVVYPQAVAASPIESGFEADAEAAANATQYRRRADTVEFDNLQRYQQGESIKNIAWKHYARSDILYRKNSLNTPQANTSLRWDQYPAAGCEQKLQHLCFAALRLSEQDRSYSLTLPQVYIEASSGASHLQQVLTALALCEERALPERLNS
ncbi:MAG: DUF58 domain-containing protein [Oceanospirillaceae bacterium]|nr:DUF58 domain-containing protein [Oceanospirillaceae bacterium]